MWGWMGIERPANGEDEGCDDDDDDEDEEEVAGSLAEGGTWMKQTSGASIESAQRLEAMELGVFDGRAWYYEPIG